MFRRRAAIVHGELHEKQVRLELQHIVLRAENAQVRSCAADRRVDFRELRRRIPLLEPFQRLHSPARSRRDAAAQITDAHFLAGFQFRQHIRQTASHCAFDRWSQRLRGFGGASGRETENDADARRG